jgi:Periplasmic copper-binding protein (NosD)
MTAFGFDTTVNVPATLITSLPITISTSGKYYLTSDLTAVGTNWNIVITASNVVLDLNGQRIKGASNQFGILVNGGSGVTIKNGGIGGLELAVYLYAASDCILDGVSATTTSNSITDANGVGNRILNCNLASVTPGAAFGILLSRCTGDLVAYNLARAFEWGVVSSQSGGNAFRANNINGTKGLLLAPGDSEEENIFTGTTSVTVSGGTHSTD